MRDRFPTRTPSQATWPAARCTSSVNAVMGRCRWEPRRCACAGWRSRCRPPCGDCELSHRASCSSPLSDGPSPTPSTAGRDRGPCSLRTPSPGRQDATSGRPAPRSPRLPCVCLACLDPVGPRPSFAPKASAANHRVFVLVEMPSQTRDDLGRSGPAPALACHACCCRAFRGRGGQLIPLPAPDPIDDHLGRPRGRASASTRTPRSASGRAASPAWPVPSRWGTGDTPGTAETRAPSFIRSQPRALAWSTPSAESASAG